MKIPTVERCCCFELETGGKILGWLGIIFGGILFLFLLCGVFMILPMSCEEIMSDPQLADLNQKFSKDDCTMLKVGIIFALLVVLPSLIVDILLIIGISTRNPEIIFPAVVFQGIIYGSTVAEGIFAFSLSGIFSAIIGGALWFYFFIVLYSLYARIKDEKETIQNA